MDHICLLLALNATRIHTHSAQYWYESFINFNSIRPKMALFLPLFSVCVCAVTDKIISICLRHLRLFVSGILYAIQRKNHPLWHRSKRNTETERKSKRLKTVARRYNLVIVEIWFPVFVSSYVCVGWCWCLCANASNVCVCVPMCWNVFLVINCFANVVCWIHTEKEKRKHGSHSYWKPLQYIESERKRERDGMSIVCAWCVYSHFRRFDG